MEAAANPPVSKYLTRPVRTLGAACREIGRDEAGRACATCALRDLCGGGRAAAAPAP